MVTDEEPRFASSVYQVKWQSEISSDRKSRWLTAFLTSLRTGTTPVGEAESVSFLRGLFPEMDDYARANGLKTMMFHCTLPVTDWLHSGLFLRCYVFALRAIWCWRSARLM